MINSLTILTPDLTFVKKYYAFISCIWTTQFYGPGEFELVVEYNEENLATLAPGNYIVKNDKGEVAIIEKIKYTFSPEQGGLLTASGRMAISLLQRRLIFAYWPTTFKPIIKTYCLQDGNVEDSARAAVADCLINGPLQRQIPVLSLGTRQGYSDTANRRVSTYQNLYSAITAFLAAKNMGHRILYNSGNSTLTYEIFKGTDRSGTMVFSRNRENLLSFEYEEDQTEWENYFYIGGSGEGTDRFVTSVTMNDYGDGNKRREYFYSANSEREDNTSDSAYNNILENEAKQECRDLDIKKSVKAEIDLVNFGLEFGEDYNVGDIIKIADIIEYLPRITTVIESQTGDGYNVDVEFDEEKPAEEES